jgi:hypothetical protein
VLDALRFYAPPLLVGCFFVTMLVNGNHRPRTDAQRAVRLGLAGLGLSLIVLTPVGYSLIGRAGIPNLARLLGHGFMLVVAWAGLAFVAHLTVRPQEASRRSARVAWWFAAGFVLLAVLFALAPIDVDDVRFAGRYAGTAWVLEYWVVYAGCLTPAFAVVARESWRFARITSDLVLSLGLRLIAAGAVCALTYHVHKGLYFASVRFGLGYPVVPALDKYLPLAANVLVFVGSTVRWWAPRVGLSALVAWIGRYRTYLGLRPLWLGLYEASPHIALEPPRSALADLLPGDLGLRLYRRVIEIRDGRIALRPYLDPEVAASARRNAARVGLSGQELDAFVEATVLADALRARSQGVRTPAPDAPVGVPGGGDMGSDTAFLTDVARAYRRVSRPNNVERLA